MAKLFHPSKFHPEEPPTPEDKYLLVILVFVIGLCLSIHWLFN